MNRANLPLLDSKAASRKIARDRNGNVSNASAKDKVDNRAVAANNVAANKVAEVSKADDKPSSLNERRETTPAAFLYLRTCSSVRALCRQFAVIRSEGDGCVPPETSC
jgi:hypothetical protein